MNGTICEWHPYQSAGAVAAICPTAPKPVNGYLTLTDAPGLGFDPDPGRAEGVRLQGVGGAVSPPSS